MRAFELENIHNPKTITHNLSVHCLMNRSWPTADGCVKFMHLELVWSSYYEPDCFTKLIGSDCFCPIGLLQNSEIWLIIIGYTLLKSRIVSSLRCVLLHSSWIWITTRDCLPQHLNASMITHKPFAWNRAFHGNPPKDHHGWLKLHSFAHPRQWLADS